MDDFLKFLRTATIQSLRVGTTQAEVRASLGPPDDTSVIKPLIWKYDDTEITFQEGAAVMIAVSFAAEAEAVRQRLDAEELPYEPLAALTYDAQTAFIIPSSRVTLTLDHERAFARAFRNVSRFSVGASAQRCLTASRVGIRRFRS